MKTKRIVTKVLVMEYPATFQFQTAAKLPRFKYGCKKRTSIVRQQLRMVKYDVWHHEDDFIVESITRKKVRNKNIIEETWELGT